MTILISPKHSFLYDGVRVNKYHALKGEGLPRHEHNYAHATMCCSGSCLIRKANKEIILRPNDSPINLIEGEWHEIESLEDGTVFINIFAEGKF